MRHGFRTAWTIHTLLLVREARLLQSQQYLLLQTILKPILEKYLDVKESAGLNLFRTDLLCARAVVSERFIFTTIKIKTISTIKILCRMKTLVFAQRLGLC